MVRQMSQANQPLALSECLVHQLWIPLVLSVRIEKYGRMRRQQAEHGVE